MENNNAMISITMEEYKELLIIKGKYEVLKDNQQIKYIPYYIPNYDNIPKKLDWTLTKPISNTTIFCNNKRGYEIWK